MNPLSRILVLVSILAATALEVRLGARELGELPLACEVAFAVAFGAALWRPNATLAVGLSLTYVAPILLALVIGRLRLTYMLVWVAMMLGGIIASRPFRGWAIPPRWRWPLVAWALVIAATWPIMVCRETDFNFALLSNYRLPNTSLGVAPPVATVGILDAVITQLLGLLWFDWLHDHFRREPLEPFSRFVVWPLAISAALACLLGTYQGFVDIGFWNKAPWSALRRAAGSLGDANVFGMVAACWGPAFVALALQRPMRGQELVAGAGLALGWSGLWSSGSRTALLAGSIGLAFVVAARVLRVDRLRTGWGLIAVGAAVAVAIRVLTLLPLRTIGPLRRLLTSAASETTAAGIGGLLRSLWERDGFGTASMQIIREAPWVGVGVGSFTLLSVDYVWIAAARHVLFDNAQNWFRHQFAELGFLGSIGWMAWVMLFLTTLVRTRGEGRQQVPASAIKGALVGFTAASMLGVPALSVAVTLTFWTFAFWYLMLAVPREYDDTPVPLMLDRPIVAWGLMCALVLTHAAGTLYAARYQFSVPQRVQRIGWDYRYGFYDLETGPGGAFRQTEQTAVAVIPVLGRALAIDVWSNDPEAARDPVEAKVWVGAQLVVDARLRDASHVARVVPVPAGDTHIAVRIWVSRTWRPERYGSSDKRELGLAVADWTFEK